MDEGRKIFSDDRHHDSDAVLVGFIWKFLQLEKKKYDSVVINCMK